MKKVAKVYEMNGCDWWIDYSVEEAKKNYLEFTGMKETDVKEDWEEGWPVELNDEQINRLKYVPDPYDYPHEDKRTFKEEMKRRIEANDVPSFFATTEY